MSPISNESGKAHDAVLSNFFETAIYVRVSRNQLRVRNLQSRTETTIRAQTPFSTDRLLVGQFTVAEGLLKEALREIFHGRMFSPSPQVVIQPLEMLEGGLSQVEERVLRELAIGAGASKVVVWVGAELGDEGVKERLNGKS